MKNVLKVLFVLLFVTPAMAQNNTANMATKGAFDFRETVLDYGTIKQNSNGERVFTFTNVGKAPIVITKVKGSCGCTVATKPKNPIMPGETAEIKVKYATNRLGAFSKTITVSSNASEKQLVLHIKGKVIQ
jgi:hypothetical protein